MVMISLERDFVVVVVVVVVSFGLLLLLVFLVLPLVPTMVVGARFTGEQLRERFVLSVSESESESAFLPKRYLDLRVLAERVSLRVTCSEKKRKK